MEKDKSKLRMIFFFNVFFQELALERVMEAYYAGSLLSEGQDNFKGRTVPG